MEEYKDPLLCNEKTEIICDIELVNSTEYEDSKAEKKQIRERRELQEDSLTKVSASKEVQTVDIAALSTGGPSNIVVDLALEANEMREMSLSDKQKKILETLAKDPKKWTPVLLSTKRMLLFMKYSGRKGPPVVFKIRLPKHGGYENAPSICIKKMFIDRYNTVRDFISLFNVHLRSGETGMEIPDDDAINSYIVHGGLIIVVDGGSSFKKPEKTALGWGELVAGGGGDSYEETLKKNEAIENGEEIKCVIENSIAIKEAKPVVIQPLIKKRIIKIVSSCKHTMAITTGGRVLVWGMNDFGQCGNGNEVEVPIPQFADIPPEVKIVDGAVGQDTSYAISSIGELYAWGRFQASNLPRKFVDTFANGVGSNLGIIGEKLVQIAAGDEHALCLTATGKVYCWGYGDRGQLAGFKGGLQRPKPIAIEERYETRSTPLPHVKQICAGSLHSGILMSNNEVLLFGDNSQYQLGVSSDEPGKIIEHKWDEPIRSIHMSCMATFILMESGRVVMFGSLEGGADVASGLLGTREDSSEKTIALNVKSMATGYAHILFHSNKKVYGLGYNSQGQAYGMKLKEDTNIARPVVSLPDMEEVDLAAGGAHSYCLF